MIFFFLLLIINCSKLDLLGPSLNQRTEAANQAAENLEFDEDKRSLLIEAYVNNIKFEEIQKVKDFIFQMSNTGTVEDKILLIIDCYDTYNFKNQDYFINAQIKEKIKDFINNKIETSSSFINVNKTIQNLRAFSTERNNIFKNFDMEIKLIEESLKFYNSFIQALKEKNKNLETELASNIIFNNSSKSIIIKRLIEKGIKPKELKSLYQEVSKILSISKGRRLA